MKKAALFVCLLAGAALASGKSFNVTLYEPSVVGGTELKAGDYKFEVVDQKLLIKHGKQVTEAPVKVETGDAKYSSTTVRYDTQEGKPKVQEIRVGGTNMKVVLESQGVSQAGGQ
ncbi:MAG: hypothetical protein U0Q18_01015 [Bryobacteraceae bacterium]